MDIIPKYSLQVAGTVSRVAIVKPQTHCSLIIALPTKHANFLDSKMYNPLAGAIRGKTHSEARKPDQN